MEWGGQGEGEDAAALRGATQTPSEGRAWAEQDSKASTAGPLISCG